MASGLLVQYVAAGTMLGIGALLFETRTVTWTAEFVFALAWLVFVLSFGAVGALLPDQAAGGGAGAQSVLSHHAGTALIAYYAFGERLEPLALFGILAVCVAGVFLVIGVSPRRGRDAADAMTSAPPVCQNAGQQQSRRKC